MSATPQLHRHALAGCRPQPLSSYLKAVGVLRVVAEQADPEARGHWQDERFVLTTTLDEDALVEFFLREWSPSPFMSPWNKGSGLLGPDKKGVGPIQASTAPRFATLRAGIADAHALTRAMADAVAAEKEVKNEKTRIKDKAGKERLANDGAYKQRLAQAAKACKTLKDQLQPECQRRWRGATLRWLRAAVVVGEGGRADFPSLFGTGGNDGKLDFTNNAMQRLGDLFDLADEKGGPTAGARAALRACLFDDRHPSTVKGGVGMYAPADSGGANATSGPLADTRLNPWELPLLLEGSLLFTTGTSRRLGGAGSSRSLAPFTVQALAAGYASAAAGDESLRGEQWLPLWGRPWQAKELEALLIEGRCQLGRRGADTAMDLARAVARLGLARGVTAFERYGFMERNGKSYYAVPLGRWAVQAEPKAALLDDLEHGDWWVRLRRAARGERAPASLRLLEKQLSEAAMAAVAHGGEPERWQQLLVTLAAVEQQLVLSGATTVAARLSPLPRLQPGWVQAADDGGAELRLALALASVRDTAAPLGGALRSHWLPLARGGRFATSERGLANDPRVVVGRQPAEAALIALVSRRLVEGGRGASLRLPMQAHPELGARLDDLVALLYGEIDLERTLSLARALSALDWRRLDARRHGPGAPRQGRPVPPAWAALRLCHLPGAFDERPAIPVDPAALRLLTAGEPARALALCLRRLQAAGRPPPIRAATLSAGESGRYAASLAFPISATTAARLAASLAPFPVA
jgi:CRISPR-associated protein Csx17